jgi:hypothetical protein
MKLAIILTALISTLSINIGHAKNQIIEIQAPGELSEVYSVFIDNGEILEVNPKNEKTISDIKFALKKSLNVNIKRSTTKISSRDIIESIELLEVQTIDTRQGSNSNRIKEYYSRNRVQNISFETRNPLANYDLTQMDSYESAQDLMNTFKGNTKEKSQCYNRAHVWTYESFVNEQVNLGKVWIFFSKKYLKEYRYKWWFHIAPFTKIKGYDTPYILDRGFTMVPYTLENWKNIYMKNNAQCKVVTKYSDYLKNTKNEYCFFMFSNQYYWQPKNLKRLEKKGSHKWGFNSRQVRHAYKDAIIDWDGKVPYNESLIRYDAHQTAAEAAAAEAAAAEAAAAEAAEAEAAEAEAEAEAEVEVEAEAASPDTNNN